MLAAAIAMGIAACDSGGEEKTARAGISPATAEYTIGSSQNVVFTVTLENGAQFESVAGNGITAEGFTFSENSLTVKSDFLDTLEARADAYAFTVNTTANDPAFSITVKAAAVSQDPSYTVRYYYEQVQDDTFAEDTSLTRIAQDKEGKTVTAETGGAYLKEGFTLAADAAGYKASGEVLADGSLELKIYYRRIRSSVTAGADSEVFTSDKNEAVKFGETVTLSAADRAGYDKVFTVYKTGDKSVAVPVTDNSFVMPAYGVTAELAYRPRTDRPYTVKYYYETLAGGYTEDTSLAVSGQGATGADVNAETGGAYAKVGFVLDPSAAEYKASGVLPGEGTLELKVYYSLVRSDVRCVSDTNGEIEADKTENVRFGETVTVTVSPAQNYVAMGVYVNGSADGVEKTGSNQYTFEMPAEAAEITAEFGDLTNPFDMLAASKTNAEKVTGWEGKTEGVYRLSGSSEKVVFDQEYSDWLLENYAGISYNIWLVDDGKPNGNTAFIPTTKDGTTSMYANGAVAAPAVDSSSTAWQYNAVMFYLLGGTDRATAAAPGAANPIAFLMLNAESVYITDVSLIDKEVGDNPFARAGGTYLGETEGKTDVIRLEKSLWYATSAEYADWMYENYAGIAFSYYQPENTLENAAGYLALNFSTAENPSASGWGNENVQSTWNLGPYGHPKDGEDKWVSVYLPFDKMVWTQGNPFQIYAFDEINYIADVTLAPIPDNSNPFAVGGAEYVGNYNGESGVYRIPGNSSNIWSVTDAEYTAWLYENYTSISFKIYQPGTVAQADEENALPYQPLLFSTQAEPTGSGWGSGQNVISTWNLNGYNIPENRTDWIEITLNLGGDGGLALAADGVFKFYAMNEDTYIANVVLNPKI